MQSPEAGQEQQFWLWVTKPEYYLDDEGNERADLEPGYPIEADRWWTCHRDTRAGDLALLWRTYPKSDIGYLMQAIGDARPIADDAHASEQGWKYGCAFRVLYKFPYPVTLHRLKAVPYLQEWPALRRNFQGATFAISPHDWAELQRVISPDDPQYAKILAEAQQRIMPRRREKEIEDALVSNLHLLGLYGWDLELFNDPVTGVSGQQYHIETGIIDVLCVDRRTGQYVVIEIKRDRATRQTFGQICGYVGWVHEKLAHGDNVTGLVLSRGYDLAFQYCVKQLDRIKHSDLADVDLA